MKAFFNSKKFRQDACLWIPFGTGCLSFLWGLRIPGGVWLYLLIGIGLILLTMLIGLILFITRLTLKSPENPNALPAFGGWRNWLLMVAALIMVKLLWNMEVPFKLAFALSRPQFEEHMKSHPSSKPSDERIWIGLFPILSSGPIGGGYFFEFDNKDIFGVRTGVYHSDSGELLYHGNHDSRLGPNWFVSFYTGS